VLSEHRLTRREREIVAVIFAAGNRASADTIRSGLSAPPGLSAVRVMLARLERKGVLECQQAAGRNTYSVTVSPRTAKRGALRELAATFFGGSPREMLLSLVREGSWTAEDLRVLRTEIARIHKGRR
jgi:predicted transcriptional regulator